MTRELLKNEVQTMTEIVSGSRYPVFLAALENDPSIVKIELEPAGANYKVTIHYAIMNLAPMYAVIKANIEQAVAGANNPQLVQ